MVQMRSVPPEPIAPWAEVVPDVPRMTVDALLALPDNGWQYELVEGRLVRMAGIGQRATAIAAIVLGILIAHVRPRRLGVITGADGIYSFDPVGDTGLIPDVGFYIAGRQALIRDPNKPIPFAPDLAVEVASPSQSQKEMAAKAALSISGGTRMVWVVWPNRRCVDVWRADNPLHATTLHEADSLEGEEIIAGFTHPVADLFA